MAFLSTLYLIFNTILYLFLFSVASYKFKLVYSVCTTNNNPTMAIPFVVLLFIIFWSLSIWSIIFLVSIVACLCLGAVEKLNLKWFAEEIEFANKYAVTQHANKCIGFIADYTFFAFKPLHDIYEKYLLEFYDYVFPPNSMVRSTIAFIPMFVGGSGVGAGMNMPEIDVNEDDEEEVQRKLDAMLDETELEDDNAELEKLMKTINSKPRLYSEDVVRIDVDNSEKGNVVTVNSQPNTPT
jgi:hypothetical protein